MPVHDPHPEERRSRVSKDEATRGIPMPTAASTTRKPVAERELTFVRTFDAPRDLVFSMWTDPKHLAQWWGPHQFDNPVCEADARAGGALLIHMRGPDGSIHVM